MRAGEVPLERVESCGLARKKHGKPKLTIIIVEFGGLEAFAFEIASMGNLTHQPRVLGCAGGGAEITVMGRIGGKRIAPLTFEIDRIGENEAPARVAIGENFRDSVVRLVRGPC